MCWIVFLSGKVVLHNHSESFPLSESAGPLAWCILGLTIEPKLTEKEQKPRLGRRKESVVVPSPGGFAPQNGDTSPGSALSQILTFKLRLQILVPIRKSYSSKKKIKVMFPSPGATAKKQ